MAILEVKTIWPGTDGELRRKYGAVSDTPQGWRQVSKDEFNRSAFFTYTPTHIELRRLSGQSVRLYIFENGEGAAIGKGPNGLEFYLFGSQTPQPRPRTKLLGGRK